jgi:hypothetical protein
MPEKYKHTPSERNAMLRDLRRVINSKDERELMSLLRAHGIKKEAINAPAAIPSAKACVRHGAGSFSVGEESEVGRGADLSRPVVLRGVGIGRAPTRAFIHALIRTFTRERSAASLSATHPGKLGRDSDARPPVPAECA